MVFKNKLTCWRLRISTAAKRNTIIKNHLVNSSKNFPESSLSFAFFNALLKPRPDNKASNLIVLILLIAVIVANLMRRIVKAAADTAGLACSNVVATIVKWAFWVFGFVIALTQLGIAVALIQSIVIGLIAMIALAGGLAFGLGGKDHATIIIEKIRQDIEK